MIMKVYESVMGDAECSGDMSCDWLMMRRFQGCRMRALVVSSGVVMGLACVLCACSCSLLWGCSNGCLLLSRSHLVSLLHINYGFIYDRDRVCARAVCANYQL